MESKYNFAKSRKRDDVDGNDPDLSEYEFEFTNVVKGPKLEFSEFQFSNKTSALKRSSSTPDFYLLTSFSKNTKTVLEITKELLLTQKQLKEKTEECQWLTNQNNKLSSLPNSNEKSLFKRVFTTNKKKRNFNLIDADEQMLGLHQKIFEMEMELENYKELKERLDEIIREKIELKLDYNKTVEIQKEILENLRDTIEHNEEKLAVEREMRQQREAEISNVRSYLKKTEQCHKKQMQLKEEKIKRMEFLHQQNIGTLNMIIKQKEEELLQRSSKNCIRNTDTLLKLLHLKTQQVNESNDKLKKVQALLEVKCKELDNVVVKLENYRMRNETVKQLEDAKQNILEALNKLKQEKEWELSDAESTSDKELEEYMKHTGDKEEAH